MTAKRSAARVVLGVLAVAVLAGCAAGAVRKIEPGRRLALVIGNAGNQLVNPEGDARLIATTLEGLGFDEVVLETNLETLPAMDEAVRAFGYRLNANDLAFFYYSGLSLQAPGGAWQEMSNYLLHTGYDWATPPAEVEFAALSFESVRRMLGVAQLRVMVLDAGGPARGRFRGGLAPTGAARGELIAYAAEANAVATDEGEGAGIYAQELAVALRQSGVAVADVFRNVMEGVVKRTEGAQHPTLTLNFEGRLYLNGPPETIDSGGQDGDPSPPAAGSSWKSPLGMEFAWVSAGEFEMGSPEGEAGREDDEVQHGVRISEGFWLGKYEVTQGEWQAVMGTNPSGFPECGARCPVEQVSWEDVQEFIRRLNERESGSGYVYRLPTEAEWEYAARAGTTGARHGELDSIAWYDGNSSETPHPVGEKRANGWGLHDMLGNVWEWTADWYGGRYPSGTVTDPRGPSTGSYRVYRGGSWGIYARDVRSANRRGYSPGGRYYGIGFRLVRTE